MDTESRKFMGRELGYDEFIRFSKRATIINIILVLMHC